MRRNPYYIQNRIFSNISYSILTVKVPPLVVALAACFCTVLGKWAFVEDLHRCSGKEVTITKCDKNYSKQVKIKIIPILEANFVATTIFS